MLRFLSGVTVLFTFVFLAGCASVAEPPSRRFTSPTFAAVARLAEKLVAQQGIEGLSVVLVDGDGVIGKAGFGYADRQRNTPATAETVYRAGSLAKLFTATAVMQLVEEGRVALDDPVSEYLPGFEVPNRHGTGEPITLRALMSHHAGLPCDIDQGMWSGEPFTTVADRLQSEVAPYRPGFMTSYSNAGYSVLGHLLQEVGERPFDALLRERIFEPLTMPSTGIAAGDPDGPELAQGYRGGRAGALLPIRDTPAMGLYTSAADLGRYLLWLLGESDTVLSRTGRQAMWEVQNDAIALDFDARMGLAWQLDKGSLRHAGRVARHGGHTPLFSAALIVLPEQRLGVAVLANSGNAEAAVRYLAEQALLIALKAETGLTPPPARRSKAVIAGAIPPEAAGRYATEFGILRIDPGRARLHAETLARTLPLVGRADGSFGVPAKAVARARDPRLRALGKIRLTTRRIDGQRYLLAHIGGTTKLFGEAVPAAGLPTAWHGRLGRYRVANAEPGFPVQDMTLRQLWDTLYLEYRLPVISNQPIRIPLAALDDEQAVTLGVGRSRGELLRIERLADGRERLRYAGYEAFRVE